LALAEIRPRVWQAIDLIPQVLLLILYALVFLFIEAIVGN
jgi:hypothetical protein